MSYIGKTPTPVPLTSSDITNGIVTGEKLNADVISSQTALAESPADTDEFLISDAGVLKRLDASHIGGGSLNLISTTTASGESTIDITGMDSTYKNYKIIITNMHPAVDGGVLNVRYIMGGSAQTGSYYNYYNHLGYTGGYAYNASQDATMAKLVYGSIGGGSEESMTAEILIPNPSETTFRKMIIANYGYVDNDAHTRVGQHMSHWEYSTVALTGLQFLMNSGNIDGGIFKLYGIS